MAKKYNRGKDGTNPFDHSFKSDPNGVREDLGGDDISDMFVTHYPVETGFHTVLSQNTKQAFWQRIEDLAAECDKAMVSHGWDRKAGNGRGFPDERTSEPFSELWYAGKIGAQCSRFLEHYRQEGLNTVMIQHAMDLGGLLEAIEWRTNFRPSILTGAGQRKHLAKLRDDKNRRALSRVQARRNHIAALIQATNLNGGALVGWLGKQLAEKHNIHTSARTIRRDLASLR